MHIFNNKDERKIDSRDYSRLLLVDTVIAFDAHDMLKLYNSFKIILFGYDSSWRFFVIIHPTHL